MAIPLDPEPNVHVFDARGIARRFRHSAIFGAPGALRNGETMRFINGHDPIPLRLSNNFLWQIHGNPYAEE